MNLQLSQQKFQLKNISKSYVLYKMCRSKSHSASLNYPYLGGLGTHKICAIIYLGAPTGKESKVPKRKEVNSTGLLCYFDLSETARDSYRKL